MNMQRLAGKLLISTPHRDMRLCEKTVIYICSHTPSGAMGIRVNQPTKHVSTSKLMAKMGLQQTVPLQHTNLYIGGPAEQGRGIVLHTDDEMNDKDTIHIADNICMTLTTGIMSDIARGIGPQKAAISLGYVGWAPQQLEHEVAHDKWLVGESWDDLLFGQAHDVKWHAALSALGASPMRLTHQVGHA